MAFLLLVIMRYNSIWCNQHSITDTPKSEESEDKEIFLGEALHFSRKSQYLAKAFQSEEIVARANFIAGLCTERLLLSSLIKINWLMKIY